METLEYYKLIRNSVRLQRAELTSLNCINQGKTKEGEVELGLFLQREVKVISDKEAEIFLTTRVGSEESPFLFELVYKGICVTTTELDKSQFEEYAYHQVVPLLLPYARECVASTMARMGLPIFTLPTMDVLDTLEANFTTEENSE